MDTYNIEVRECRIHYTNRIEKRVTFDQEYAHYRLFHELMDFMREMGFSIEKDPEIRARFKSIADCYWYGKKGGLEFNAEYYPAGFKIKFFQNENYVNQNGGRYDFNKWEKMPYRIRLEMIRTMMYIKEFFRRYPIRDISDPECDGAESEIKLRFAESFHHPEKTMDFDLHDLDGTVGSKYDENNLDRDGKEILNGQIKYTRDYKGYLVRGRVYYDLNRNWIVILNQGEWICRMCNELFDLQEGDVRGRSLPHRQPPMEYQRKMEMLHSVKTSWLEKELRRRKKGRS